MTRWHPTPDAARDDAKTHELTAYRLVEHVIEDREIDFPVVWYRCEPRAETKVWSMNDD